MKRLHFSVAGLMGAVTFVAVGCAALRYASEWWASGAFTLAIALLLAATLGAILRRGSSRRFWFGFALFGGAYLLMSFGPWIGPSAGPRLITTRALIWLEPKLRTTSDQVAWANYATTNAAPLVGGIPPNTSFVSVWDPATHAAFVPAWNSFQAAGHSLFAIVAAFVGGVLAARFFASPRSRRS